MERKREPARRITMHPLRETLLALTMAGKHDVGTLSRRLSVLQKAHGEEVYARFIHLISHLDFSPKEARKHWEAIVHHTTALGEKLERQVDFRIALADYFLHKHPRLRHPKVIEIHLFNETEAGNLRDGLTGLFNFKYLREALPREVGKSRRIGTPLSLIFFDVDHFKAFNDQLGHEAGNQALARLAGIIREAVRDMDLPCRYGGEEFAVLLPATDKFGALTLAERILRDVEKEAIPSPSSRGLVTLSAGVASYPADAASADLLLQKADEAMYLAKAGGRNRAVPYSTERRAHTRNERDFGGTVTVSTRMTLPLAGRNLSQGGLFFLSPKDFPRGQSVDLLLTLPGEASPQPVFCKGRVARCNRLGDEEFGVGVSITHIHAQDRLRFFQVLQSPST